MSETPVRFAVVGAGHIAQVAVLPAFEHAENAQLSAIVTGDHTKRNVLGERYGVTCYDYGAFESLLESGDIDAIYIALPNDMHCEFTEIAAARGVHVLCEKPMAVTEDECVRMIDACERGGVQLMCAYRLHFEPAHMAAIAAVRDGTLGRIRCMTSVFTQEVKGEDIRLRAIERGGGTVYDMGVYCINAARYLFRAEPMEVMAMSDARPADARFSRCDEVTGAVMRFDDGRVASFVSSFGAFAAGRLELFGDRGRLVLEPAYSYSKNQRLHIEVEDEDHPRVSYFEKTDQFAPELVHFADCIRSGRRPEPDGLEGLADVRIARAINESAGTGRAVRIDPVGQRSRPEPEQAMQRPPVDEPPREIHASSPHD